MEPKRLSLEAANQQLAAAEDRLHAVQNKIATLEEALLKLKAEYTRATDAKLRCQVIYHTLCFLIGLIEKADSNSCDIIVNLGPILKRG